MISESQMKRKALGSSTLSINQKLFCVLKFQIKVKIVLS